MSSIKVFEINFTFIDGSSLNALIEADDSTDAVRSLLNVWEPPAEITSVRVKSREFFQIQIPSLTGFPKSIDD
jgi:hypothetical protein